MTNVLIAAQVQALALLASNDTADVIQGVIYGLWCLGSLVVSGVTSVFAYFAIKRARQRREETVACTRCGHTALRMIGSCPRCGAHYL